jgi:hypothetical protein
MKITKYFVTYLSPGTFFSETTTEEIEDWDIALAVRMSYGIKERHSATPYGFFFTTRERGWDDFDSKEINKSNIYYLGGNIWTLKELEELNNPEYEILIQNMKTNHWDKVIVNNNSWRSIQPLKEDDVVLQYVALQQPAREKK